MQSRPDVPQRFPDSTGRYPELPFFILLNRPFNVHSTRRANLSRESEAHHSVHVALRLDSNPFLSPPPSFNSFFSFSHPLCSVPLLFFSFFFFILFFSSPFRYFLFLPFFLFSLFFFFPFLHLFFSFFFF